MSDASLSRGLRYWRCIHRLSGLGSAGGGNESGYRVGYLGERYSLPKAPEL